MICKITVICCCILAIHLSLRYNTIHAMKLIIDTDAGGDDAVAILLALTAKEVQVVAITCSYGNTDLSNVERNVLKILTIAQRSDIPVYAGARKPLLENYTAGNYFGNDGFGDFEFDKEITKTVDRSKHASIAMIDLAKKYSDSLNIITLGPLTNIALAMSLDPHFTRRVKRFYVMGSAIDYNHEVEFNFGLDPESNAIFLNSSTNLKKCIIPWDVVIKNAIPKEWRTEVLGKMDSEFIRFLNKVERKSFEMEAQWHPADSIAIAAAIWPELITDTLEARMSAITCGLLKGSVHVEHLNVRNETKNVKIITNFNVSSFQEKLLRHFNTKN